MTEPLAVDVVLLDPALEPPAYAHPGDAGLDLRAREGVVLKAGGGRAVVGTGVAVALPPGTAGLVVPRSGLAARHGVTVANAPGLLDSGYRDELRVVLLNTDPAADYEVRRGDRVAQLVVVPVQRVALVAVDALGGSARGTGGFGSTGR